MQMEILLCRFAASSFKDILCIASSLVRCIYPPPPHTHACVPIPLLMNASFIVCIKQPYGILFGIMLSYLRLCEPLTVSVISVLLDLSNVQHCYFRQNMPLSLCLAILNFYVSVKHILFISNINQMYYLFRFRCLIYAQNAV